MDRLQNIARFIGAVLVPFGRTMTSTPSAPWTAAQVIVPLLLGVGSTAATWWSANLAAIGFGLLGVYLVIAIFLAWEREHNVLTHLMKTWFARRFGLN